MAEIALRPFTAHDLPARERWAEAIQAPQHPAPLGPKAFAGDVCGYGAWVWYVVSAGGEDVGMLWLEKERADDDAAVLGILLDCPESLGQRIGRQAIRLAIRCARAELGFDTVWLRVRQNNARAIAAYQRCGFSVVGEGVKVGADGEALRYFVMELKP